MKNKLYKILYYICFILTLILAGVLNFWSKEAAIDNNPNLFLYGINLLLFIIITVLLLTKKKLNNVNISLPIIFILFIIIATIIGAIYNSITIWPLIHVNYYITFILIDYLALNLYTLLSISKEEIKSITI